MAFSYWESKEWLEGLDLGIVGGGIVGLSAALFAQKQHPHWRIAVLDSDPFGGGGTSKNAGFACFGSATELMADRITLGDKAARELVQTRLDGLRLLRETLGDAQIGFEPSGSMEFFRQGGMTRLPSNSEIFDLNGWLAEVTGVPDTFEVIHASHLAERQAPEHECAIFSRLEGVIDTGKMNRSLRKKVAAAGIDLITGLRVHKIEPQDSGWHLHVQRGDELTPIRVPNMIVATNAFATQLIPHLNVQPVKNQVLVTAPIPDWDFRHSVHLDAGYVYARNVENRMLIGGGRHWNVDAEETERRLIEWMHSLWPRTQDVAITHRWTGTLGIGDTREPIVRQIDKHGVVAVRLGGMGVAIGMSIGRQAANLLSME